MRIHSANFKNAIKGDNEIKSILSYVDKDNQKLIEDNKLHKVTPYFRGNILKSVMKELEIETDENLTKGTIINYKLGIKVGEVYEYMDYGNYIVYNVETLEETRNEIDTNTVTYKVLCYDKMLYSMKDNEKLDITYPITIRDYLQAICTHLGIGFASVNSEFANYNKLISKELYFGQNYTFRDILDEIAQATASIICINSSDELEVRYPNNTSDTINGDFIKNINVNFGKKYTPNSIVLSRSGESDNVFLQDSSSIKINGVCEVKIVDNQIMNWDDRSDYLPDILFKLLNINYYVCNFVTTGICYYELGDVFEVDTIGSEEIGYSCMLLNDILTVEQGIEEEIYSEEPKTTETDYKTSAPTDKSIKNAIIQVDKNGSEIVLKANDDGKVVQVQLKADANEGSVFKINADSINLEGYTTINKEFKIDKNGSMFVNSKIEWERNYTEEDRDRLQQILTGNITPTKEDADYLDANGNGILDILDLLLVQKIILGSTPSTKTGYLKINSGTGTNTLTISDEENNDYGVKLGIGGGFIKNLSSDTSFIGGNPIIESGSNDNGEYIKFYDGTLICTKRCTGTVDINETWGNLYDSGEDRISLGNYPMSFISFDDLRLSINFIGGNGCWIQGILNKSKSYVGDVAFCSATSKSVDYMVDIIAIGRWKE